MSVQLSDDDIAELKKSFAAYDLNGDGKITHEELKTVMSSFGGKITDEQVTDIIKQMDTDKDGKIDFNEFLAASKPPS